MLISDFKYDLPDELIARFPTAARRGSRLLEVTDSYHDRQFANLPNLLQAGDLLVFNDTKVIPARLHGRAPATRNGAAVQSKSTGAVRDRLRATEERLHETEQQLRGTEEQLRESGAQIAALEKQTRSGRAALRTLGEAGLRRFRRDRSD